MSLFDGVAIDAAYDKWFEPPRLHGECSCIDCHVWHQEEGIVPDNYKHPDFACCTEEIEAMVEAHEWCLKHMRVVEDDGLCEECI